MDRITNVDDSSYIKIMKLLDRVKVPVEYPDVLIALFLLTISRQYVWVIQNNIAAWIIACLMTAMLIGLHLKFKEQIHVQASSSKLFFTLFIIVPFFIIYCMRVALPDVSFDVLWYHIMTGERALRGFPYIPGDYFPQGRANPLPTPDMFTGIFRKTFGYRLGTIGNFLIFIWIVLIVDRFLKKIVNDYRKRYLLVFLIVSCEHALFLINNYLVDLLAVPLLLESTWLLFNFDDIRNKKYYLFYIGLLLGMSSALKLTNLAYIIPLLVWMIIKIAKRSTPSLPVFPQIGIFLAAFLIPILPFTLYMYVQTENPVFPFYNKLFRSEYWLISNYKDIRFGGRNIWEILFWPIVSLIRPERLSELNLNAIHYSGRMTLAFITALLGIVLAENKLKTILAVWFAGMLLWSATTGYIRYAIYLEVLGGIIIAYFISQEAVIRRAPFFFKKVQLLFLLLFVFQALFAMKYTRMTEWSLRTTFFDKPSIHKTNLKRIMNDYTLKNDLDVEVIRKIDHAGAWAIAAGVGAYSSLLNGDIPLINIYDDELLTTPKATQKFANSLKSLDNGKKELLAFCDENYYQNCFYSIQKRGFTIKTFKKVPFTYYGYGSGGYLFDLNIQRDVLLSGNSEMSRSKPVTKKAMTEGALNPVILAENGVSTFRRDSLSCVNVKIKNTNSSPFLAINGPDGKPQFSISYHLLDEHKHPLALEGMRTPLIVDVQPLQEISLCAFIKTPVEPGSYILQFDLVQSSGLLIESKRSKNVDIAINVN